MSLLQEFVHNFTHNLFKPLLLFFYAGFLIPVFKVKFEFPKAIYQGLTIYLLLAIGWHGGEELAGLSPGMLGQALGFMLIGFCTNTLIGVLAYYVLTSATRLRKVDAATVAGYYGSDSAGTFVTAIGVLTAAGIAYAPYMPVMLAVMEVPGCLVALYIVSRLRQQGMDALGNMPGERGYSLNQRAVVMQNRIASGTYEESVSAETVSVAEEELVGAAVGAGGNGHSTARRAGQYATKTARTLSYGNTGNGSGAHDGTTPHHLSKAEQAEADMALETTEDDEPLPRSKRHAIFSKEMLHEVLLNPGIYLLFAGITIGFFSRLQGSSVTDVDDALFVTLFQGVLCLFLLEMGMTASQKLKDLASGGWQFILYGLLAPNLFATTGILVAHGYSLFLGQPFEIGTYVLFAVLCGAASYIAVPAVQRLAIPEASPTLPLAASLGLTFSYNVTIGIPVYILIAKLITSAMPIYV